MEKRIRWRYFFLFQIRVGDKSAHNISKFGKISSVRFWAIFEKLWFFSPKLKYFLTWILLAIFNTQSFAPKFPDSRKGQKNTFAHIPYFTMLVNQYRRYWKKIAKYGLKNVASKERYLAVLATLSYKTTLENSKMRSSFVSQNTWMFYIAWFHHPFVEFFKSTVPP